MTRFWRQLRYSMGPLALGLYGVGFVILTVLAFVGARLPTALALVLVLVGVTAVLAGVSRGYGYRRVSDDELEELLAVPWFHLSRGDIPVGGLVELTPARCRRLNRMLRADLRGLPLRAVFFTPGQALTGLAAEVSGVVKAASILRVDPAEQSPPLAAAEVWRRHSGELAVTRPVASRCVSKSVAGEQP